jgi:uracil-DNA glycosylase
MGEEIDRKKLVKRVEDAYKEQVKVLKDSIYNARKMLVDDFDMSDPVAIVTLGTVFFNLEMGKRQGLARIDQMIAMAKMQEQMKEQGKGCAGCGGPQ